MRLSRCVILVGLAVAGCGDAGEETRARDPGLWVALTERDVKRSTVPRAEADGRVRLVEELPAEAWRRLPDGLGSYCLRASMQLGERLESDGRVELRLGERPLERLAEADFQTAAPGFPVDLAGDVPGVFAITDESLLVRLRGGEEGAALRLERLLTRTQAGADTRPVVGPVVGEGIPLWSGEELSLALPARSSQTLRFRFAFERLGRGPALTPAELVVLVGEREVFREPLDPGLGRGTVDVALALGASPAGSVPVRIEHSGERVVGALLDPVVGPTEIGSYGARPWPDARPDVVVFLADTFRADNLAAWGGPPDVAPELNALAARSLRFLETRAVSVWTLPTHATLFTGLYPLQHGAIDSDRVFSQDLVTIAEHFRAAGYRTGAITDGLFLSPRYALDQGFAWFEEIAKEDWSFESTLAKADRFLDADDGRPVFLFVHSYRTHSPYRTGPEEDESAEREFFARVGARMQERETTEVTAEIVAEFAPQFLALYRRGVSQLDRQLGPWVRSLESRGLLTGGLFCFTSDHGEEFYEHGNRYHRWAPHEEKIRVPLFLHGGGLEPGDVTFGASQIDLAPTLAAFAGLPARDDWVGRSLLDLDEERTLLAYNHHAERDYLAAFEGARKVHAPTAEAFLAGEVEEAYDLATDPAEADDLSGADWAAEFARRAAVLWRTLGVPVTETETLELDDEALEALRALGYAQ